jgi:undecaprenyl-diphosphatase
LVRLDDAAVVAATDLTRSAPVLHRALVVWQEALQPGWVNLGVLLACVWAARRHGLRARAQWTAVTVLVGWGVEALAKVVVQRARPVVDDAVGHASGFSFPSGHASNTTTAGLALAVLVWPLLGRRARAVVPVAVGVVVVLTALDRVFLGVHHPSDVVAGVLVGGAVAGASYVGFRGWGHEPTDLEVADDAPVASR